MKPEIRRYVIELNKDYIKNKIGKEIDKLCEELKKCYTTIDKLNLNLEKANKERVKFIRAYCEKIGVIISQKEFNKLDTPCSPEKKGCGKEFYENRNPNKLICGEWWKCKECSECSPKATGEKE